MESTLKEDESTRHASIETDDAEENMPVACTETNMPVACVACEGTNTPAAREETDTPVARETESVGAVALLLKYFGHNVLLDELRNGGTLEPACAADVSAGEAGGGGAHDGALRALPQNGHDLDVLYSEL